MSEQLSVDSFGQMIDEPSLALFFVAVVFFLIGSLASGIGSPFHSYNACCWITSQVYCVMCTTPKD